MHNILYKALRLTNHYEVSIADLKLHLQSHPDYPNVKAITDTLDYFGVENLAATVPKEYLSQLPKFFFTLVDVEKKQDYALAIQKKHKIILEFSNHTREILSHEQFDAKWTGNIIAIEGATKSDKPAIRSFSFNQIAFIFLVCLAGVTMFIAGLNLPVFGLTMLSALGLFLSYLIAQEEFGLHNQTVASVCSAMGSTNCAATIKSASGKLFNYFSLADACIIFFLSLTLINIFFAINYTTYLLLLSASLPFLLYSQYLQGFVLKQWCVLCLGVTAIVLAQVTMVLVFSEMIFLSDAAHLLKAILLFGFVFIGWMTVKPLIKSHLQLPAIEEEFLRFKRNKIVLDSLLRQKQVEMTNEIESHLMTYGATHSNPEITFILNPSCGHCTSSYKQFKDLLNSYDGALKINLMFNLFVDDKANDGYQIAHTITKIYQTKGKNKAISALDDWFAKRDATEWQQRYGKPEAEIDGYDKILLSNKDWCKANKLTYTPLTLVNNFVFPREYKKTEMPMLLNNFMVISETDKEKAST